MCCKKTPIEEPKYIFVKWSNNSTIDTFSSTGHDTSFLEERRKNFILMINHDNPDTNSNKYWLRVK